MVARRALMRVVTLAVIALAPGAAMAAPSCTINTLTSVAFGTYDPISPTPLDSVGTIVVHCTGGDATVTYAISAGSSGSFSSRTMAGPSSSALAYNLYTTAAYTSVWGDGTGGSVILGPITILQAETSGATSYIYGRMPAGQHVAAGTYAETLTLMITF